MANWKLTGRDGLVKVMNESSARYQQLSPDLTKVKVKGYIGQAKYLWGFSAGEIERALGLPPHSMTAGAYIYRLSRLPVFDEVDFKFSLAWPDGKVPSAAEIKDMIERRNKALAGLSHEPKLYPPGGAHIPQWQLNFGSGHSGIPGELIQIVSASQRFHRPGGSDLQYAPHKRKVKWGGIL